VGLEKLVGILARLCLPLEGAVAQIDFQFAFSC